MSESHAGHEPVEVAPDAALVLVDVQKGFDESEFWGRRDNPDAERNIGALLEAWQESGRPVVLVRHDSSGAGSPLRTGYSGNDFKEVVRSRQGMGAGPEVLVTKSVNSAFHGTPDLAAWLRGRGVQQVVIAGIQTNMCNETTARVAGNLGFDVLFVLDAMHTFDLTGPFGWRLSAEELTRATAVSLHGGRFARVVRTEQVLGGVRTEAVQRGVGAPRPAGGRGPGGRPVGT